MFLLPLAFGRMAVPFDDLTQNYPVRVLVGWDLRAGHLPLWDPYIWSGTPLLAGFNAGAFYPATLLFAFLPAPLSWDLGQVSTYALCGTGLYLFLRRTGIAALPAWLGSLAFTWGGFMAAHEVHMGLVEGTAWIGWILLALDHVARPGPARRGRPAAWTGFLGLTFGLVALAGDPRALSSTAVVVVLFWPWLWWRHPEARRRLVAALVGAGVVGGLIASAQLLPGLASQLSSQRAGSSLQAFGAGSLSAPRLILLAIPFLLGGFGSVGLPPFDASYNIAEVTGYVGLLTVTGALAVTGRLRGRRAPAGTGLWALLALVGALLALGTYTPLGDLLVHVPLYGGQRLQSRNLAVVDLALCVLFSLWADRFLRERPPDPGRLWALAPAAVVGVVAVALAWKGGVGHWMGSGASLVPRTWPFVAVSVVTAAAVTALIRRGAALAPRRRALATAVLVLVDLGFFYANAAVGWTPSAALAAAPADPVLQGLVPPGTRYAIYDPALLYDGYTRLVPGGVVVPDLNVLYHQPSEQGYGSVVWGPYDALTGSHTQGNLLPQVLSGPLADQLDLGLVLSKPGVVATDLALELGTPRWRFVGLVSGLEAWRNQDPLYQAWVQDAAGRTTGAIPAAGPEREALDGGVTYEVTADGAGARVVRSQTWAPDWVAVVRDAQGRVVRTEPVTRAGLLQAAGLPGPGRWTVSFAYRPTLAYAGLGLAAAGVLVAVALMCAPLAYGRRP